MERGFPQGQERIFSTVVIIDKQLQNENYASRKVYARAKGFNLSFFESAEHFKNYIRKIIKTNTDTIDISKVPDLGIYVKYFYNNKFEKQFTWDLRTDVLLLEKDNMFQWLNDHKNIHTKEPFRYSCSDIEHIFTEEFKKAIFDLEDTPGVYSFWVGGDLLYIGTSINLQSRIVSSFSERFRNNTNQIYLRYIKTNSRSDACVLEVYLICKLNPPLNGASNYGDEVTLKLLNEPEFSKPVPCNIVV